MQLGQEHTRRDKTELTNNSSQKDELNRNPPITLLISVLFFVVCFRS